MYGLKGMVWVVYSSVFYLCTGQHTHGHKEEERYSLNSPKPTGISQRRLTHGLHFRDLKCMCTHNKISHLEGLQRTAPIRLVALALT